MERVFQGGRMMQGKREEKFTLNLMGSYDKIGNYSFVLLYTIFLLPKK